MLNSVRVELDTVEARAAEIVSAGDMNDDLDKEIRALAGKKKTLLERRSAIEALISDDDDKAKREATQFNGVDPETRERVELRSKARLGNFLVAAARGRMVDGPEAELAAAAGVSGIPLELWDVPVPAEQRGVETRAVAAVPGTVGLNLDPIRPAIFANSIAARLGIDMPRVASGTYATATISTSQSAAARTKSAAAAGVAGAMTVATATPKSVSARLELTIEDIAAVGAENFESALRQNLGLALSDELDNQAINGDGSAPNLTGMLQRLTDPSAPGADVADFDAFVAAFAAGVDGLWATMANQVGIVVNPETYRLALQTFRDISTADLGDVSFSDYAMEHFGGFWTNKRMPDKANHVAQAILYRSGRTAMGASAGMRTAVCPHWGVVNIDDIYSGSAKGERYFTMHVLLGDVILVQPDAYAQVSFRVSS